MTKGVENNVVPQCYPFCWMKDTGARRTGFTPKSICYVHCPRPHCCLLILLLTARQIPHYFCYGATAKNRGRVAVAPLYHDIS